MKEFARSLQGLGQAQRLYKRHLPEATASLEITTQPLWERTWVATNLYNLQGSPTSGVYPLMSREVAFACILNLETGNIDPGVNEFHDVHAISIDGSMFASGRLTQDPGNDIPSDSIIQIVGNIGKAGVALLIPPSIPQVRKFQLEKWHLVQLEQFDGSRQTGCFQSTSIHLSFTGYERDISPKSYNRRSRQLFFIETKISVHEKGKWIADLDVLKAVESDKVRGWKSFAHTESHNLERDFRKHNEAMTSVDCWEEMLDGPPNVGVIRAAGNWMARLASVAIAHQLEQQCWILPLEEEVCWKCVVHQLNLPGVQKDKVALIL